MNGAPLVETRYTPCPLRFPAGMLREGEVRYVTPNSTLPTRYTFTGQYSHVADEATDLGNSGFGLLFFNAGWYDPYLNHFTQPDSIVPDQSNPQDWDRYSYGLNNPSRFTDPSGHRPCDLYCEDDIMDWRLARQDSAWQGEWNVKEQEERTEQIEAVLYGGEKLAVSVLFEPADWAITAYDCVNGDCSPWAIVGLLPIIPASAGKYADDVVGAAQKYGKYASSEAGVTIIGYSEDVEHYLGVSGLNRLFDAPNYSWDGVNIPFLDEAMERGDTIVLISDLSKFENRYTHLEVQYILEKGYDKLLRMFGSSQ